MSKNLVNLCVNPCKMCMPMGIVSAFYGLKNCMTILHGSQGCSTYIRRHMATHYNEPVDIASSSLTENGTVFGGENNLIKGLENMIELYNPEVIGIATTCLAETIGEDVPRIINNFNIIHPGNKVKFIPVVSMGYSETQYEGFFMALRAIVENVDMVPEKNNKVNIITGMISPADTRYLKRLLDSMKVEYILLPDISENLDGQHKESYNRLPEGGTSLEELSLMGGAKLTIELTTFTKEHNSPAQYLYAAYGVPFVRCSLPVGLRDTDALISVLEHAGGTKPEEIMKERGRYMDAMIDSHKYNAEGRAVIFGEPDFVYSAVRLCAENGIMPVITATGAKCGNLKERLEEEVQGVADFLHIDKFLILEACDFDTIEKYAVEYGANIMIGSSDGRRIEEKLRLPLVRCAFPIHDQVGGQRVRMLGYDGSLELLDRITNSLLIRKEHSFRGEMHDRYYKEEAGDTSVDLDKISSLKEVAGLRNKADIILANKKKTETHPCFNGCGSEYARMHLPIAPKCNIQCNYCVRKYDCPNESRPGVTTEVLSPEQACEKYKRVKEGLPNLKVVGIAGPGDSLADFESTRKTLSLIKREDPEVTFCLSTNGLLLPLYADELAELGVSHVTVTMNAVNTTIGAKIYKHVDYMGHRYFGEVGAAILMANQLSGIKRSTSLGLICKVNIVMLKGINEYHIPVVVEKAKELGCEITNIMQLIPVAGSEFENIPLVSNREIMGMRKQCGSILKQMYHCRQCRADAIGTLDNDQSINFRGCTGCNDIEETDRAEEKTFLFAVSSKSGILVDQHFGHASDFYIYEYKNKVIRFKERRSVSKYCDGAEGCDGMGGMNKEGKMEAILETVKDCNGVLAMRIGEAPKQKLKEKAIETFTTYDRIENAVRVAAEKLCV
ncbi:nitrogenase cofactor biosynthesis protein NifB [Ruminiclostridium sufflavum DSM 19573]|uniref:FeMo cofactor biosynthesis protein NifB n=1 Tax=Ruminiclostridium sufflavum DSM 19573 TaxID=1121337 RepID=A0A318XS99_9FIRM|nr:nitrogenase component 1 [Ruminiclostridium sufflavum]PYG84824.1 nitrogenase cofactor biosynthesis protein NifB [Ruminiclostridium sufflavum DSM 19573]